MEREYLKKTERKEYTGDILLRPSQIMKIENNKINEE
jgi:hypothetical protein